MEPKIMLIGLGSLGDTVLELLVREESLGQIVVCSLVEKEAAARCNLARLSGLAQGRTPRLFFFPLDLNNREAVIDIVERESPDLILNTASLQPWWLPDLLPQEPASLLKSAGFGVWLPFHLTLAMKLMEALHEMRYPGVSLVASFPDVVNCILGRIHLAATCGIGNLDEVVPKVRTLAAERLQASVEEIRVILVAHHALQPFAFGKPLEEIPPYFLRIEHRGKDVTEEVNGKELLFAPYEIPPGPAIHYLTAGSAVRLIKAFFSEKDSLLHAPSPRGLPGGYPVIVSQRGIRVAELKGLSLEEAIAINEHSHRFDGIEKIEPDGMVVFCDRDADVLKRALGYDCRRLSPSESEARAEELTARFREYAKKFGVAI